jgi:hypothetical protein
VYIAAAEMRLTASTTDVVNSVGQRMERRIA